MDFVADGRPRSGRGATSITVALAAFTVAVTAQSLRVLFPSAYGLADRKGNATAAGFALVVGLLPLLTPLVRRVLGHRRAMAAAVSALGLWRIAVQVLDTVPLALAAAGTVIGFVALTFVLTAPLPGGSDAKGVGLLGGLALDAALLAGFTTWDAAWQRGVIASLTGGLLAVCLAGSGFAAARRWAEADADPVGPTMSGAVAIGALLVLEQLFLVNPGYLAAAAGVSLSWATVLAVIGGVGALAAHTAVGRGGFAPTLACGAVMAVAGYALPAATGTPVVGWVMAAQLAAGAIVARALAPARVDHEARAEIGFGLGWFALMAATLLFQLHYDQPLPFSNRIVTAALGLLTAVAALGEHTREPGAFPVRPVMVVGALAAAAALAVPIGLGVTGVDDAGASSARSIRVVQWNVRQGVDRDGHLDPEAIADAIEAAGPADLVVLNEVARGWPLSGQLDMATWLSRRLDLPYVWGGAASRQFGNLVLSRLPIRSSAITALPVAGDAQGRSFVTVRLALGDGTVTLLATHLQHRNNQNARQTRMREIGIILGQWNGVSRTVLAGDLNPAQGDPPAYPPREPGAFEEIKALLDAGFSTSADLATCSAPTSGRNCSDYVLVTPDLRETSFAVVPVAGSDHRLVVTDIDVS